MVHKDFKAPKVVKEVGELQAVQGQVLIQDTKVLKDTKEVKVIEVVKDLKEEPTQVMQVLEVDKGHLQLLDIKAHKVVKEFKDLLALILNQVIKDLKVVEVAKEQHPI